MMSFVPLQKVLSSLAPAMGRPRADPQRQAARSLTSIYRTCARIIDHSTCEQLPKSSLCTRPLAKQTLTHAMWRRAFRQRPSML